MGELFLMCQTESCSHQRFVWRCTCQIYVFRSLSVNNGKEHSILIKCVCVYVHVCVYVCVRERERVREAGKLTEAQTGNKQVCVHCLH